MKMRVGTRIIFSIFILIILALCAAVFLSVLELIDPAILQPIWNAFTDPVGKYACAAVAVVLFVVGVCLLFFGSKKAAPSMVTLTSGPDGSVSLTVQAVEELALRCVTEIQGITVQKIQITPAHINANVKVKVEYCVKNGVEIPGLSEKIKEELKQYLEKYAGITVGVVELQVVPYKAPVYPAG